MNLYEIDKAIEACIIPCIDPETGELLDELIDQDALNALQMEKDQKVEDVACWVKNLNAEVNAYKAEKAAFAKRQSLAEKKVERLKKWLADALAGQKFSTAKCAVSFRKAPPSVQITDESQIPADMLRIKTEPDKIAIKAALSSGQEVAGCELVRNLSTIIK